MVFRTDLLWLHANTEKLGGVCNWDEANFHRFVGIIIIIMVLPYNMIV